MTGICCWSRPYELVFIATQQNDHGTLKLIPSFAPAAVGLALNQYGGDIGNPVAIQVAFRLIFHGPSFGNEINQCLSLGREVLHRKPIRAGLRRPSQENDQERQEWNYF